MKHAVEKEVKAMLVCCHTSLRKCIMHFSVRTRQLLAKVQGMTDNAYCSLTLIVDTDMPEA